MEARVPLVVCVAGVIWGGFSFAFWRCFFFFFCRCFSFCGGGLGGAGCWGYWGLGFLPSPPFPWGGRPGGLVFFFFFLLVFISSFGLLFAAVFFLGGFGFFFGGGFGRSGFVLFFFWVLWGGGGLGFWGDRVGSGGFLGLGVVVFFFCGLGFVGGGGGFFCFFLGFFWGGVWGGGGVVWDPAVLCLGVGGGGGGERGFVGGFWGGRPHGLRTSTSECSPAIQTRAGAREELLKEMSLSSYYDEVALKGLELAARDLRAEFLTRPQVERIKEAVTTLVMELADYDDVDPETAPKAFP